MSYNSSWCVGSLHLLQKHFEYLLVFTCRFCNTAKFCFALAEHVRSCVFGSVGHAYSNADVAFMSFMEDLKENEAEYDPESAKFFLNCAEYPSVTACGQRIAQNT